MSIATVGKHCTGCRVCKTVCHKKAIDIKQDCYGYEYPTVNPELCVECIFCEKVCPAIHTETSNAFLKCGAAYALDEQTKFEGSSGGLFGAFAKAVIAEGGLVFGAAFDENLQLKTKAAETIDELAPLYKSKYLLCDTDDQFQNIREELKKGRKVLYCASPCQISAIRLYLGKDYDNLLLLDFVCHGVGSQSLFDKSVEYTERAIGGKIYNFSFRQKKAKASSHYYSFLFRDLKTGRMKERSGIYMQFPYYYAYQKYIIYRDCCYECPYASEHRQGDITIADFHTIDRYVKDIDRFAGVSMFVCNTEKGLKFFEGMADRLRVAEMSGDEVKKNNRFGGTEQKRSLRKVFLQSLKEDDFSETVNKYLNYRKDWRYYYYKCPRFVRELGMKLLSQ